MLLSPDWGSQDQCLCQHACKHLQSVHQNRFGSTWLRNSSRTEQKNKNKKKRRGRCLLLKKNLFIFFSRLNFLWLVCILNVTHSIHHSFYFIFFRYIKIQFERVKWYILVKPSDRVGGEGGGGYWKPACFTRSSSLESLQTATDSVCKILFDRLFFFLYLSFFRIFTVKTTWTCHHDLKCVQPEWINWSIHDFKFVLALRPHPSRYNLLVCD